jgi:hypothetical protein
MGVDSMSRPVFGFGMLGMGGRLTDPNEIAFSNRVRDECGVDIQASPYRDYDEYAIASAIDKLPVDAVVLVWGTSLGANDCTVVANYTKRTVHGIFGFQASLYGAHALVTPNVLFAHLFYSYNPIPVPGLGAYKWQPAPRFDKARLHLTPHHIPHPGDYDRGDQDIFLGEMKRIIAKPGD